MLKIGITGNMGSGKSTVAKIFMQLGIPVYDADSRAKAVMVEDEVLVAGLIALFGPQAYLENKQLNRTWIAEQVFHDKPLLEKLNALVHPAVFKDFDNWVLKQTSPYVLKEAALMFESDSYKSLDKVIMVLANDELRLKRILLRDNTTKEQALARMKNQMSQEEKKARSNFVINNNEEALLIPQVYQLHQQFLVLAKGF